MIVSYLSALLFVFSGWQIHSGTHFDVYYQKEDRYVVEEIALLLERKYGELTPVFGQQITEPVKVYVHPDQSSLVELTRIADPSRWLVGLAINGQEIHIVSPLNPPANHSRESVYEGLVHELVHICVHHMLPHRLPLWLNEGLAVYYARQVQFAREVPGILRARYELPVFKELTEQKYFERNRGYPLSYTIVECLVREYGEKALHQFLADYPNYSALGLMSEMQLERVWQRYLDQNYLHPPLIQKYLDQRENVFEATFSPNPMMDEGKLAFVTAEDALGMLRLLDPWGEPMQVIFQRPLRNGFHEVRIDASRFPAGIYYLELSSASNRQLILIEKK